MGLYLEKKTNGGALLTIWELTESELELGTLVPACCGLLGSLMRENRRKERLAVQALLCKLFGDDVRLDHDLNGRPFLPNKPDHVSIAHTQRFVVVMSHPVRRVGVDIERLDRNFSTVEARALAPCERSYLSSERRPLQLAILWSAKEAFFKYISQEKIDFATQMEIEPFIPEEFGVLCARFLHRDQTTETHFLEYQVVDNHILTYIV